MKSSYKKHLYTTTLSLSAAVLLSVIGHGQASADSLEAPQTEPSTVLEATPTSEPPVTAETTSPSVAEKKTPQSLPLLRNQQRLLMRLLLQKLLQPLVQALTVLQQPLTKRLDWRIAPFISLKRVRLMTKSKKKLKLLARSAGP